MGRTAPCARRTSRPQVHSMPRVFLHCLGRTAKGARSCGQQRGSGLVIYISTHHRSAVTSPPPEWRGKLANRCSAHCIAREKSFERCSAQLVTGSIKSTGCFQSSLESQALFDQLGGARSPTACVDGTLDSFGCGAVGRVRLHMNHCGA